jgi:hypothetical protein
MPASWRIGRTSMLRISPGFAKNVKVSVSPSGSMAAPSGLSRSIGCVPSKFGRAHTGSGGMFGFPLAFADTASSVR